VRKRWWTEALKGLFAVVLVFWLVRSGKLDPTSLRMALRNWPEILASMGLIYAGMAIAARRWEGLLRAHGLEIGFGRCFSLTMIGMVFGLVTPAGAGGDLAKMYYVGERGVDVKKAAILTVVIDRLIGLLSLLLLAAFAAVWNWRAVAQDPKLTVLFGFVAAGAFAGLLLLTVGIGASRPISRFLSKTAPRWLVECVEGLAVFRRKPGALVRAILLSVCAHLATCAVFALLFRTLSTAHVSLKVLFLTVPFSLVASAMPITPAGIGVGQTVFFTMLQQVARRGTDGSNAFTLYQCLYVAVSLTGLIFYFARKRESRPLVQYAA
jgi:uncharacterized protein (TIRG00374 family)